MATTDPVSTAAESWIARSDAHAQPFLDAWARFEPEQCSALGMAGFDRATRQLPVDRADRLIEIYGHLLAVTRDALGRETHPEVRFDLGILVETTELWLAKLEAERYLLVPYPGVLKTVYLGLTCFRRPTADSLARLRRYTGRARGTTPITEQAEHLVRAHLDTGRLPPYRGRVERDLRGAPRLLRGIRDAFAAAGLQDAEDDLAALEAQVGRWASFLRGEVLPQVRESFRLPAELYRLELRSQGVALASGELIRRARVSFREIANEMRSLARIVARERGMASSDPRSVLAALRGTQLPRDEIAEVYRQRLLELRRRVEDRAFATVPERDVRMCLADAAESFACPGPHLRPPRLLAGDREPLAGEPLAREPLVFAVPAIVADPAGGETALGDYTFDDVTWTLTIHEAMPGHGLHYACVLDSPLSRVRTVLDDNCRALIEGWAQYAEAELRPDLPAGAQLVALQQRQLRAARAFLDPGLHLGRVTVDEASRILTREVGVSTELARLELERYTFGEPGVATTYFAGCVAILELRAEVEERLGPAFDLRVFHDLLLRQGFLDPRRLRDRLLASLRSAGEPLRAA